MILLFSFLCLYISTVSSENKTERDLHEELFNGYNPNVKPLYNVSEAMYVSLKLSILSVDNIDEKKQSFSVRGFLEVRWTDEFLTWNPDKYNGVTTINVQTNNIWLPDLALRDVYSSPTELGQSTGKAVVDYNGSVVIWPYSRYTVACKIKIRYFPFDAQTCELTFLSWTNPSSAMILYPSNTESLSLHSYRPNGEWELASHNVSYYQKPYSTDTWDQITFTFLFRRKALFQVMNIIAPIVCITLLNLTCFIVPAESGEKVALCISMFLTLAVFLSTITSFLPESSDEVSILSIYVCIQLLGSGITIICTVASLHLYHKGEMQPVTIWFCLLCKMCCLVNHQTPHVMDTSYVPEPASCKTNFVLCKTASRVTWKTVSRAFDRLCLVVSIVWNICLITGLLIALHQ